MNGCRNEIGRVRIASGATRSNNASVRAQVDASWSANRVAVLERVRTTSETSMRYSTPNKSCRRPRTATNWKARSWSDLHIGAPPRHTAERSRRRLEIGGHDESRAGRAAAMTPGDASSGQLFSHPVADERPVLVRDVVADVIALGIHDELGVGRLGGHALGVLPGNQAVELTEDDEERLLHAREHAREIQLAGPGSCLVFCRRSRVAHERLTRDGRKVG